MKKSESDIIPKNKREVKFTQRQLEILDLWVECDNAVKIAEKMNLSVHTIRTQLKRMRGKLAVRRTFDVYRFIKEKELK